MNSTLKKVLFIAIPVAGLIGVGIYLKRFKEFGDKLEVSVQNIKFGNVLQRIIQAKLFVNLINPTSISKNLQEMHITIFRKTGDGFVFFGQSDFRPPSPINIKSNGITPLEVPLEFTAKDLASGIVSNLFTSGPIEYKIETRSKISGITTETTKVLTA